MENREAGIKIDTEAIEAAAYKIGQAAGAYYRGLLRGLTECAPAAGVTETITERDEGADCKTARKCQCPSHYIPGGDTDG